jgi:hypothetical protein
LHGFLWHDENGWKLLSWRQYSVKRNRGGYGKITRKPVKIKESDHGKGHAVDLSAGFTMINIINDTIYDILIQ